MDNEAITHFSVEMFNESAQAWRTINDRIKVGEFLKPGVPVESAVAKAQAEAARQVTGWQAAYPQRRYRAVAVRGYSYA